MAIKEQDVVLVAKDTSGNKVIQMPITRVENVEGAIKTINKVAPDATGNVAINTVANATKATQDASGNVITTTYATKTELSKKLDTSSAFTKATADTLYLGKSAKAVSAGTADTATKATQDGTGKVIATTYATKSELTSGLNGKLGKTEKATAAITADSATKAAQDDAGNVIVDTYATKDSLENKLDKTATAVEATKLGKTTVGGSTTPIYLKEGVPTSCSSFIPSSGGTFTGTVYAPAFQISSDKRLKTDLNLIEDSLSKVATLKGYTYNMNGYSTKRAGLIAQDIKNIFPEAVMINEEGWLTVDYAAITALLINAVNELNFRISNLKG